MQCLLRTSLFVLVMAPGIVLAGPGAGSGEFSLAGTGSSDKDFNNSILAADVGVGRYLTPTSEVGLRQSVGFSDSDTGGSVWSGASRLFYDFHFDTGTKMRPLIGVNLGYIYGDQVDETFIGGPEIGLKYYVLDQTFISVLVEYQLLFDSATDIDSRYDDGVLAYGIGMGFNF